MFDVFGTRVDEIIWPAGYTTMLKRGYQAGIVWRAFDEDSLSSALLLGYITSFYDPGMYCPFTVSLSSALPLSKYAPPEVLKTYLPHLLRKDEGVWQGATWMTEAGGGSDLGAQVNTIACRHGQFWQLTGEKYFASNAGAELAVAAARPENAPPGVRGLALFLVPRLRIDGSLNYTIRRLKDKIGTRSVPTAEVEFNSSEAYLLGQPEIGVYLVLEVLNISRVANSIGAVALTQRALRDALLFAEDRPAFGKMLLEQPLLLEQFRDRTSMLHGAFALAWEAVQLLDQVWQETPGNYSARFHLFRLVVHLAKYWTAENAMQTAKWAMEVHGGMGVLAEYQVERWLREAMILSIWEGPAHRQILDALEVMEQKKAHLLLIEHLSPHIAQDQADDMIKLFESHFAMPADRREALAEPLIRTLAAFASQALLRKLSSGNRSAPSL